MTPQEQELVDQLFDRLAELENTARDPQAERLIADGLKRAPHAVYALVQTALVQDEALKRANARIEELQAQFEGDAPQPGGGSFLDTMRDAVLGKRDSRSSVPSVGAPGAPTAPGAAQYESPPPYPQAMPPYTGSPGMGPGMGPGIGPGMGGGPGAGGSFLGGAASTAAGVLGGALLLDGIRSMFGHHAGGGLGGGLGGGGRGGPFAGLGDRPARGNAADSDLARDAGVDHIDHGPDHGRQAAADTDVTNVADRSDDADEDFADDDGDFDGDDFDGGDDYA